MTKLLERAFARVSKLPEKEQDGLAKNMLEEIAARQPRKKSFSKLKMPDFAARAKAISGGRKIDPSALLDYNKGPY